MGENEDLIREMLEALKELVRLGTHGTGYVHADWIEAHEEAKAAIAKAEAALSPDA